MTGTESSNATGNPHKVKAAALRRRSWPLFYHLPTTHGFSDDLVGMWTFIAYLQGFGRLASR
jgi:hypothetical protein